MWLVIACTLGLATAAFAASDAREKAARAAEAALLRLNFFAEGNGMHLSPGLVKWIPRSGSLERKAHDENIEELFQRLDAMHRLSPAALASAAKAASNLDPRALVSGSDELIRAIYRRRWGIGYEGGTPVGLFKVKYEGLKIGALGCVACHGGRAAGQFIVGLGNKNIDTYQIGRDVLLAERIWKRLNDDCRDSKVCARIEDSAIRFAELLKNKRQSNATQGLVPVAVIRQWFYAQAGQSVDDLPPAVVKVPALWGYGPKRGVGQFCDGFGDGDEPGWAIAVELVAGQTPDVVRRKDYLEKVEHAEMLLADLLPPKYPFAINEEYAKSGKVVFEQNCKPCHGTYEVDEANHPIYQPPNYIEWKAVRTDDQRLVGNSPEFRKLVATSPLSDLVKARDDRGAGYFAPRLVGVWARYPYLHNGSVPSVGALLTRPEDRPRTFSLRDAGERCRFDEKALGLTASHDSCEASKFQALFPGRDEYDTTKPGQRNDGHSFGTKLPDTEKRDLIEYLKQL